MSLFPPTLLGRSKKRQTHFQSLGSVQELRRDTALLLLPITSLISIDISVALAGSDRAWWGRSCSNPSTTGFFSPGDTNGNDHVENSYWDFGFANPRDL